MEYRPVQISYVIREINRSLFLPAIQREFEWEPERVEKLFDLIMGDYPIGSFLFWKIDEGTRPQWTTYEFFRDFDEEHPHNREASLLGVSARYVFGSGWPTEAHGSICGSSRLLPIFVLWQVA